MSWSELPADLPELASADYKQGHSTEERNSMSADDIQPEQYCYCSAKSADYLNSDKL
ncbi:MAG: hypothetical protein J5614_01025 [Paludibacteraceae bacterium]|nr:hypothetical protein [Paludibacteraceae bacterium]